MLKGLAIGFVLGAAVAAGLFKALESRREAAPPAVLSGVVPDGAPAAPSADPGEAALREARATIDSLRAENRQLRDQILALATDPKSGRKRLPDDLWREVAGKLAPMLKGIGKRELEDDPAVQEALIEMFAICSKIAKEYGVTLEEAMMCPDGLPLLMLSALDSSATPPTEAQRAQMTAAVQEAREKWDRMLADRGGMGRLEQRFQAFDLCTDTYSAMTAPLSEEQRALTGTVGALGGDMGDTVTSRDYGTREEVTNRLADSWARALRLEEGQAGALKPVAEDYVQSYQQQEAAFKARREAGEKVSDVEVMRARMQAMIEAQKKVPARVPLSPIQGEALKNWTTLYHIEVTE